MNGNLERPRLPDELTRFTRASQNYKDCHVKLPESTQDLLERFLNATLDEVRLHYADRYANEVLRITDIDDARHFRQGVLRREASGNIEYQRQRDHAAHTLHNYLMGWYLHEKLPLVKDAMCRAVAARLPLPATKSREQHGLWIFSQVWPFVSLLHDIGYLFEGGLETLSVDINNKLVRLGAEVVQEYFHNRVWLESPLAAASDRVRVREWTGISEPDFSPFSVTAVGDSLRALGNLDVLWAAALRELEDKGIDTSGLSALRMGGQGDAFRLWENHYKVYSPRMEARIRQLETGFYALIWDGVPGLGLRILDHGVSGGLLLLLYATFYFQIIFGIRQKAQDEPENRELAVLVSQINERLAADRVDYHARWWWTVVVWGTAATALHNQQQEPRPWRGSRDDLGPLSVDDDPLAYLGIVVDILQEWDRYTVSRSSIFTGELPLQGKDVRLWTVNGLVHVDYGDAARAKKVRDSLELALKNWKTIVVVLPV